MATKKKNTKATKAATKTTKSSAPANPYTAAKLRVQAQCPLGSTRTYSGRKLFDGKKVKVVEHEARGGIVVEVGNKKYTVSPFALGIERPDAPKPKAKTTAKGKAAPAKKSPPSPAPAPEAPAPSEPAKAPAKARLRRVA
jgi:hypothetical protein